MSWGQAARPRLPPRSPRRQPSRSRAAASRHAGRRRSRDECAPEGDLFRDICLVERLIVVKSGCLDTGKEAEDRVVGVCPIRHQQVGILGGAHKAVGDHAEPADHDIGQANGVRVRDDPSRSGPEGSRWDMAGANGGGEQLHCLTGERQSASYPLGGRQCLRGAPLILPLLAIELGPLGLVTGLQQCLTGHG